DLVTNFVGSYYRECLGRDSMAVRLEAIERVQDALLRRALDRANERLRRYEIKFGSRSVPLNWVELGLYQMAFQRLPGFGPSVTKGPGPWEPVASYSPAYATLRNEKPVGAALLELGTRHYNFWKGWGTAQGMLAS